MTLEHEYEGREVTLLNNPSGASMETPQLSQVPGYQLFIGG